jgi:hypothetical protein
MQKRGHRALRCSAWLDHEPSVLRIGSQAPGKDSGLDPVLAVKSGRLVSAIVWSTEIPIKTSLAFSRSS